MRIAIVGQRDFGKAVFEAFLGRGDTVAGVFCAPEGDGRGARQLGEPTAARIWRRVFRVNGVDD